MWFGGENSENSESYGSDCFEMGSLKASLQDLENQGPGVLLLRSSEFLHSQSSQFTNLQQLLPIQGDVLAVGVEGLGLAHDLRGLHPGLLNRLAGLRLEGLGILLR